MIKKYFSHAKIAADLFHVIRLLNHLTLKPYQSIDPEIKYQRGSLSAFRTNPDNLSSSQQRRLHRLLMQSEIVSSLTYGTFTGYR
ncbi:MAG: transposase [Gammaproteobacteria bacterium]|nr:transposase [Gammaproteobacteria bacterium]